MKTFRNFLHYLVSILLWILFGYYWYVVSGRKVSWGTFQALIILTLVSLLGLAVTVLWIRHNLNIARDNRRRGSSRAVPESFTHDHLGRPVIAPKDFDLKQARIISISLDAQGNKVCAAVGEVPD